MALTEGLDLTGPNFKEAKHTSTSITDGAVAALISGVTGKRIKIWRLDVYAAVADKTCEFLSGTDSFTTLSSAKTLSHEKKSVDGIPVFTCNDGEDFKADPSDSSNWYFYIVYTID